MRGAEFVRQNLLASGTVRIPTCDVSGNALQSEVRTLRVKSTLDVLSRKVLRPA
jgi:hypothetical protein